MEPAQQSYQNIFHGISRKQVCMERKRFIADLMRKTLEAICNATKASFSSKKFQTWGDLGFFYKLGLLTLRGKIPSKSINVGLYSVNATLINRLSGDWYKNLLLLMF